MTLVRYRAHYAFRTQVMANGAYYQPLPVGGFLHRIQLLGGNKWLKVLRYSFFREFGL